MSNENHEVLVGQTAMQSMTQQPQGGFVQLGGETYYHITNYDQMPPFS
ncbi:MAG: hypothetical protein R3293_19790 [Candidatus Promineifilaceae bacterium]|nr:hypothetical protein [Candidatus Promineifilaceae bacterium]